MKLFAIGNGSVSDYLRSNISSLKDKIASYTDEQIKLVIVPNDLSDFTDTVIGIFQQALCVDHPQGEKVLRRTYLHVLFEITNEPVRTDILSGRSLYNRYCILRNALYCVEKEVYET